MNRLSGKVAIITGGATGIGEAIAKKFAKEGASVIVNGFPEDPVDEVVNEIVITGGQAFPFIGDISLEENARRCIEFCISTFGKLDILINNAGVFPEIGEIDKYSIEAFDYMIKNNVRSTFLMTHFAIPELQKSRGNIVFAGSESGLLGIAENAGYGGTKGFMHAFAKGIAVEQARYGVRANCVAPGPIDTAWTHRGTGPMTKKLETMMIDATPMGRRGTPEEVANVYLFLASEEASYVTGALYSVDGGITISKGPVGLEADKETKKEPKGDLSLHHSMDGATDMSRGTNTTSDGSTI